MSLTDRLNRHKIQDANRNLTEIQEEIENIGKANPEIPIESMAPPEQRILDTQLLKLYQTLYHFSMETV